MEEFNDVEPVVEANDVADVVSPPADEQVTDKEFNFRTVQAERDRYREEVEQLRASNQEKETQASINRALQQQAQQTQQTDNTASINFNGAVDEEQLNTLHGIYSSEASRLSKTAADQDRRMEELELKMLDKDYNKTIKKYLPKILQDHPERMRNLEGSRTPLKDAYYEATHSIDYILDNHAQKTNKQAEKAYDNAMKPKTLGTTGSAQPNVNGGVDIKSLSAEDFAAVKHKLRTTGSL